MIRFWGTNYFGCPIGISQTFIIRFYQRNAGDPTTPGPEVSSFTLTATPQPINLLYLPDYMINVTFPAAITLLDGWVSISRVNIGDGCQFIWYGEEGGGNSVSFDGNWEPQSGALAFCLGVNEALLVTNWALYIGIGLILVFAVVRFRKMV